jgi:hypothetical protein
LEADVTAELKVDKPLGGASSRKGAARSVLSQRVRTTLSTAAATGLIQGKKGKQLSGRVHETLFEAAATKSGLRGTELIDYALAKVALEDDFAEQLIALKGSIAVDVDLGA